MTADRVLFIDGNIDPWFDLTYHSKLAPGRMPHDGLHPEYIINGGGHGWDFAIREDLSTEPQYMKDAHLFELGTVGRWLKEFPAWKAAKGSDELR